MTVSTAAVQAVVGAALGAVSAVVATSVLGSALVGCGDARRQAQASASHVARSSKSTGEDSWSARQSEDHDVDGDSTRRGGLFDADDAEVSGYGRPASTGVVRAVEATVAAYYRAAIAHDGATGCALMDAEVRSSLAEAYGRVAAGARPDERGCAAAASHFYVSALGSSQGSFERTPAELRAMRVVGVRTSGLRAIALLATPKRAFRYLPLEREGGAWKVAEAMDAWPG